MSPDNLTPLLKNEAARLGFALSGACPAVAPTGLARFFEWISLGYAGEMSYLVDRQDRYAHPEFVLEGARSLLMLAFPYRTADPALATQGFGRISRYAWGGVDYHNLIHERLKLLIRYLQEMNPVARSRGVVDTAPLMEREFAQLAGLGWIGKNTLVLNREFGSWFFLAALLTNVELSYDAPFEADHCGTCRACLDACPTQAFPQPYVLDATRCISYLTIELSGEIPLNQRNGLGDWVFGCDICQEVCPWNHKVPVVTESGFGPQDWTNPVKLTEILGLSDDAFRQLFRKTPLWRAKRRGLLRNAAIVLGNQRWEPAVAALEAACKDDDDLVRNTCRWALSRIRQAGTGGGD